MKNSVLPLLVFVAAISTAASGFAVGEKVSAAPAAETGGFSTNAGVQTGTLGAAPTGVDAATTGSVNPDAAKTDTASKDACKDTAAGKAPNAAGAAAAAKLDKGKCERPHYETAMGMMTDPNTPVADTKPATGALPKLSDLTMLDAKPVNLAANPPTLSANAMSNQLGVLNKTAPTMSNVNFSGYDSLAAPQSVQSANIGAAQIQAMRNAEGRTTMVIGGDGSTGIGGNGKNGTSVAWDDSLVKTGTEVANTTSFHQPAPGVNTDSLGNVVVPKGLKGISSQQLDMATYINQRGVDLGVSDQVRQVAISTALRESAMNTMNFPPGFGGGGSSAYGLGQNLTGNWYDNTKKFYGDGVSLNRNNTDNQIDMLFNTSQDHVDTYNSSQALQSKFSSAGQYDYAMHYAGEYSLDSNGNPTNSVNAQRVDYAKSYFNRENPRGVNLYDAVNDGSNGGSVVSSPAKDVTFDSEGYGVYGGKASNPGGSTSAGDVSILGGVLGGNTNGGIKTGNSAVDSVVNGVVGGGQGTNMNGMLNTGGTQLSSNPLLGALGGAGQSASSSGSGSTGTTGTTTRPVTVNIDNDTSTVTEVTDKDGVKTTTVTKTDNTGKVLESSTTTEEKVVDTGTVTKVTVKDGVKTTTVTKSDSTGKVLETSTKTEKVDAAAAAATATK